MNDHDDDQTYQLSEEGRALLAGVLVRAAKQNLIDIESISEDDVPALCQKLSGIDNLWPLALEKENRSDMIDSRKILLAMSLLAIARHNDKVKQSLN